MLRDICLVLLVLTANALAPEKVTRRAFVSTVAGAGIANAIIDPATAASSSIPEQGKKAPDFSLPNSRGDGSTSLDDLLKNGKFTVLYFYPGAFTTGCTLEARFFQRDIEQYRALNTQIVGVSVDPPEKNAQFCEKESLDFYMLSDIGGTVSKAYGSAITVPGIGSFSNRQTYIIDETGNLRAIFLDVESRIPKHSAEVLEKLKALSKQA